MQIPISEARAKLPGLIKQLQKDPNLIYEITVHQVVVAELKSPAQLPAGREAAKELLTLIDQLPKTRSGQKGRVSENVKQYLYSRSDETAE